MDHDLEVFPDPAAVTARAAGYVAGLARAAVAAGSRFSFAVSGGQTPWAMFRALAAEDMPWASAELFQLDERVAPAGDADRNLTHLRESLGAAAATGAPDAGGGRRPCRRGARLTRRRFPQGSTWCTWASAGIGHIAFLVPGDRVRDETSALVAVTCPVRGTGG